jgi:hypothetical protein
MCVFVCLSDKNIIQESGKEGIYKDETPVNVTQQGRKRLISSENSESVSAEQDAGKKYKNFDQEKAAISSKVIFKRVIIIYFLSGVLDRNYHFSAFWIRSSDWN